MACPHMDSCSLYPLFSLQALLNIWKVNFCEADFSQCKRFQLGKEGRGIPPNLLPNGSSLKLPGADD